MQMKISPNNQKASTVTKHNLNGLSVADPG